jgi:endo-1,4-beta-xylanase
VHALRPSWNQYDFTESDALSPFANAHHLQVCGHTLVWHYSVPDWLKNESSQLDLGQLLIDPIHIVVGRNRGCVHSWDVVNEAIHPDDAAACVLRFSYDSSLRKAIAIATSFMII